MAAEIAIRLAITAALIVAGVGLYWGWSRWQLRRLRRAGLTQLLGLEDLRPGVPAVLYFTTPDCAVCRAAQRPALERLRAQLGDDAVQIVEVDATEQTSVADYWGVLSVPTTFVIDTAGQPRAVNHGLASHARLLRQIEASRASGLPSAGPIEMGAPPEAPILSLDR